MYGTLQEVSKLKQDMTFSTFDKDMSADISVANLVFQNCVIAIPSTRHRKQIVVSIVFAKLDEPHVITDEVGLQFITCGGTKYENLSMLGYISAFDKIVWLLVVLLICFTGTSIYIFRKERSIGPKFNEAVAPIYILLEQGIKYSESSSQYILAIWFIMGVVISNAYKGQNITELYIQSRTFPQTKCSMINWVEVQ